MKWVTFLLLFFFTICLSSQNLYLKFETEDFANDSLVNNYLPKPSFKDFNSLKKFVEDFYSKLQYEGFINSRITEPKVLNDSVFLVKVNLRKKYNTLEIENFSDYRELESQFNSYVNIKDLPNVVDVLINKFSKEGKPFTTVKFDDIAIGNSDTIRVNLSIDISEKRYLDQIVLKGYEKFPMPYFKNYANIKTGKAFDRAKLIEQSEKLNTLQFARQTKSPQVQFTKDSTKLYVYLERRQANSFDGFIGFNNSDENEFQLNGNIDLKLINNFHNGEEINLNYKNDGNAQEWFNASIRLPYLFKTRFSIGAGLGFFKQDSTFSNTRQHLKLEYQINSNLNVGLDAAFENSSNLLDDIIREDLADFNNNRYGLSIIYHKARRFSNLFFSNQQISFSIGLGNRTTDNLKQNQQYFELNASQIFKVNKRQYIYLGAQAGYLDSDSYLSNELYRFGGVNSIRGFAENRFFANLYGVLQTEYRYVLGSNLYVHSVLDYGFYENEIDRISENLYSVGFGFGLETKAGILRLIFANGGSDSQNIEFRNTQLHIKFVSIF